MRARNTILALAALLAPLSGCTGITIKGKVMTGEIARVVRVADADERLEQEGLGEITVSITQGGAPGRATAVLGSAVSKPDGSFTISIANEKLRAGRIQVLADAESIFKVQNLVEMPREGESLLVQVIERTVPPPGETVPDSEKEPE